MLIIVYSETNDETLKENLGKPEYSYYFVLNEFLPVLRQLGTVTEKTRGPASCTPNSRDSRMRRTSSGAIVRPSFASSQSNGSLMGNLGGAG